MNQVLGHLVYHMEIPTLGAFAAVLFCSHRYLGVSDLQSSHYQHFTLGYTLGRLWNRNSLIYRIKSY